MSSFPTTIKRKLDSSIDENLASSSRKRSSHAQTGDVDLHAGRNPRPTTGGVMEAPAEISRSQRLLSEVLVTQQIKHDTKPNDAGGATTAGVITSSLKKVTADVLHSTHLADTLKAFAKQKAIRATPAAAATPAPTPVSTTSTVSAASSLAGVSSARIVTPGLPSKSNAVAALLAAQRQPHAAAPMGQGRRPAATQKEQHQNSLHPEPLLQKYAELLDMFVALDTAEEVRRVQLLRRVQGRRKCS
jgi:hypothetical protein